MVFLDDFFGFRAFAVWGFSALLTPPLRLMRFGCAGLFLLSVVGFAACGAWVGLRCRSAFSVLVRHNNPVGLYRPTPTA